MHPNFLLITADDMNFDSLGVTGCKVPNITPNIDRLAEEGIRFAQAHVTIAVCQPSRSVLMTGRYPHNNGALGFDPTNQDVPTLSELLHGAGYLNGIVGKETHLAPKDKFFWDHYVSVFDEAGGFGRDPGQYYEASKAFFAQAQQEQRPFFLMANSHDPHRPFAGSEQERKRWGRNLPVTKTYSPDEVDVPGFLPDIPDVRQEVAEYLTSVHRCDATVGEILRALDEAGLRENTLVIFLSDNGMAFPFAKTNCYLNSTRTPWIIRWPGQIQPGQVDAEHFISGIDFLPTILDAAELPMPDGVDGKSFLPLLAGEAVAERDDVFTVFNTTSARKNYPMRCVQNRRYGYIFNQWSDQELVFRNESQNGLTFKAMQKAAAEDEGIAARVRLFEYRVKEELYDFAHDPNALNNLAGKPEYQGLQKEMQARLLQKMVESADPLVDEFRKHIKAEAR